MPKALQITSTGELFRIADSASVWNIQAGAAVRCYDCRLDKKRKGGKKKSFKGIEFIFDPTLHSVVETSYEAIERLEEDRAKLLVCRLFHPDKCSPSPRPQGTPSAREVMPRDVHGLMEKLYAAAKRAHEFMVYPTRFDRTKESVLTFDLGNVLSVVKRVLESSRKVEIQGESTCSSEKGELRSP